MSRRIICPMLFAPRFSEFSPPCWSPGCCWRRMKVEHQTSNIKRRTRGGGEIRTHEAFRPSGFQDRRNQPLCHPSWEKVISGSAVIIAALLHHSIPPSERGIGAAERSVDKQFGSTPDYVHANVWRWQKRRRAKAGRS